MKMSVAVMITSALSVLVALLSFVLVAVLGIAPAHKDVPLMTFFIGCAGAIGFIIAHLIALDENERAGNS
jgi:hypothetical protein